MRTTEALLAAFPAPPERIDRTASRDFVLELAAAWDGGTVPLAEVRRLTTAAERYACRRAVVRGEPEHALLCRLFEALVAEEVDPATGKTHVTSWGCITEAELRAPWMFEQHIGRVRARYEAMQRGGA